MLEGLLFQAHHSCQVGLEPDCIPDELSQLLVHQCLLLLEGLARPCMAGQKAHEHKIILRLSEHCQLTKNGMKFRDARASQMLVLLNARCSCKRSCSLTGPASKCALFEHTWQVWLHSLSAPCSFHHRVILAQILLCVLWHVCNISSSKLCGNDGVSAHGPARGAVAQSCAALRYPLAKSFAHVVPKSMVSNMQKELQ